MRGPGILWMLQTAAGMSMAGPIFYLGMVYLRTGRYVWAVGFLTIGALVLYFPTYLVNRIGGPRTWIRRRLRSSSGETDADGGPGTKPDGETETETDTNTETDTDTTADASAGPLERFRRR